MSKRVFIYDKLIKMEQVEIDIDDEFEPLVGELLENDPEVGAMSTVTMPSAQARTTTAGVLRIGDEEPEKSLGTEPVLKTKTGLTTEAGLEAEANPVATDASSYEGGDESGALKEFASSSNDHNQDADEDSTGNAVSDEETMKLTNDK